MVAAIRSISLNDLAGILREECEDRDRHPREKRGCNPSDEIPAIHFAVPQRFPIKKPATLIGRLKKSPYSCHRSTETSPSSKDQM